MCSRERSAPPHDQRVRAHRLLCLLRLALWLTWHGIGQRQGTSESETAGKEMGVTTGLTSPSLPYFAVKPFILLRDVEVPEGIPLAVEVGGS